MMFLLKKRFCAPRHHIRQLSSSIPESALTDLRAFLGTRLTTASAVCEQHGRDESYHALAAPQAVAFAESTEEVSQIMQICTKERIPVIPFGAGSSLEGHISATRGGLSVDLNSMNSILQVSAEDMSCRVGAGVTRQQLDSELRATGLFFPVDPGATASIGGMVGTNASGTTTVRYGNMKQNTMGLTVVMADGKIIKTGTKARKSSAGYDLTRLFIGSEGTLGIITEIELRLHGIPAAQKTAVCSFESIKAAVDSCTYIMQMGIPVARLELMDERAVEATNAFSHISNPVSPTLVVELHGSETEINEQSEQITDIVSECESSGIAWASSDDDRKKLWTARHNAWYATLAQMPGCRSLSTDVAVPISSLADVIVDTQNDLKDSELIGNIVGHVGDGNFHVFVPFKEDDIAHMKRVKAFSDRLVKRALKAEGTCTGEHGIGNGKMEYLKLEHGDSIGVMRSIKQALDPLNILNPDKIFSNE